MIKYFCDVCGKEIPMIKKKHPLTNEYVEKLDIGEFKCKQINMSFFNNLTYHPNAHTCRHCAEKISLQIDNSLLSFKLSLLSK